MFWSLAALNGMTVIGADAGNKFAETDLPEDPLFMSINDQYQRWWTKHLKKRPIPKGYVLPIQHAIQGHLESPWLWKKHINTILRNIGFKSTTHERYIYQTKVKNQQVLFLWQVDDFAVASKDPAIAKDIIARIGAKLQVPLNHLGVIANSTVLTSCKQVTISKSLAKHTSTKYWTVTRGKSVNLG